MAKKKIADPVSYLLIRDEHGFKIHHPEYGPCLLTNYDGGIIENFYFESAIVGEHPERGSVEVWGEGDSIGDAVEDLKNDGYKTTEIKKMKIRVAKVVTF